MNNLLLAGGGGSDAAEDYKGWWDGTDRGTQSMASRPGIFRPVLHAVQELKDVDLDAVKAATGVAAFGRGRRYALDNKVVSTAWEETKLAVHGSVVGSGGLYSTIATFAVGRDQALEFRDGMCSCPVGYNCKHVVALVIVASDHYGDGVQLASATAAKADADARSWEKELLALIEEPRTRADGSPLAIELSLSLSNFHGREGKQLIARPMREGARGGWVNGSLTWSGLDSWQFLNGDYRPDHVALARELYVGHAARQEGVRSYYAYGSEKTLDLSAQGSHVWTILDEAARIGLPLVHADRTLGELPHYREGELLIDVTSSGGEDWSVRSVLRVDGENTIKPVLFLGSGGHGLLCAERADISNESRPECWRLRLVRLAKPTSAQLQRMVLRDERLNIPGSEFRRFADELYPSLARVAPIISSDGSFSPPEISAPTLVLRANYGADHTAEVGWEWLYRIGDNEYRTPAEASATRREFRDPEAERTILADTRIVGSGLERYGLLDEAGRPAAVPAVSTLGFDTMQLAINDLPQIEQVPEVGVEVTGQPVNYRDVSESLSIGLSTAGIAGERDWFGLRVSFYVDDRELPFTDVFTALANGDSQMLLADGAHFSLLSPRLQSLRQLIEEARALADSTLDELRISRYQAGLWAELAALGTVTEQAEAWQSQVGALLELNEVFEHDQPAALKAQLRPYQREGFGWLAELWRLGLGGILADDMGLGKTLQALALICHAHQLNPDVGPFLVVAPTSVVQNWVQETNRFAPNLNAVSITDTLSRSGRAIDDIAEADIVVTTYTLFRLEADAYSTVDWAGLMLDEAQNVKNHQSKTYRCVRELAAPFKLAITGTPMENNLLELWSLLSITAPGLFPDPKRFSEQYARPIERDGDSEQLARLRRRIKPLVKRRSKELVARDLPQKQEQILAIELHPRHRKIYDTHLQRERQKILGLIDDFNRNRFTILRSITLLRQMSLHPGLIDEQHATVPCAKLDALVEQLGDVIGGGHRALVFSQFTGFLTKARERLDREGISFCYLDGRTRRRDRVLERFKEGADPVFLISLKAGGSGLNLTEAGYCFLLDPWWNPAIEAQAIDRVHRIGQTRQVMAYRLIARDTVEEKVVALAGRKADLFSGVMDDGDMFANGLSAEDIRGLLA